MSNNDEYSNSLKASTGDGLDEFHAIVHREPAPQFRLEPHELEINIPNIIKKLAGD